MNAGSAGRRAGWFGNLSMSAKFAVLGAALGLSATGIVGAAFTSSLRSADVGDELAVLNEANALVLQLDTRASELKVDAYSSLVRPDPQSEVANVVDDVAKVDALLGQLAALPLSGTGPAGRAYLLSWFA